jgi:thioredoxin reductase (NADPH)
MVTTDILVVGGGPAGLTAGIYGSRSGHKTTVLEKSFAGGQMALTSDVENYPGFAKPVNGMELAQTMEQQAQRFGCTIANLDATGIRQTEAGFEVRTTGDTFVAGAVVICSGAQPRKLGIPGEKELTGRGVSYCAVCDGPLFRGREVAVVGGGDSALDEAFYLSNIVPRVHVIHRRDEFRGCKLALDRLRRKDNITFHLSTVVTRVIGTDRLESLDLAAPTGENARQLTVAGLFIYVGWLPNTQWCGGLVALDPTGAITTDDRLQASVPGIFAAGDVRATHLRQVATAVGDGALAAMMAHDYLASKQ